jgi:iron complex transport system ATP-binding protein
MNNNITLFAKNVDFGFQYCSNIVNKFCIKNLNFCLNSGDFVHLAGTNGAGKTTLIRILSGFLKCLSGGIYINSKNIKQIDDIYRAAIISVVPQKVYSFANFDVGQIIEMSKTSFRSKLFGLSKYDYLSIQNVVKAMNIENLIDRKYNTLSNGEKQKVIISMAIAQESKILFLDEALASIDINSKYRIMELLKKLNREKNITILMSTHEKNIISNFCNRLIHIKNGIVTEKVI